VSLSNRRKKSSAIGRVVAQAIKPEGLPYQVLLDKYAQKRYGKNFAQLLPGEASQVAGDTIDSAGRTRKGITTIMRASKGLIAVVSVYQVVTADDWKFEISHVVLRNRRSWCSCRTCWRYDRGIIGGLAGEGMTQLARWFFGGSSSRSAKENLGPTLLFAAGVLCRSS
jgi:hypothetical protein